MDTEKELLMNQTYQQFLNAGFGLNSADTLDDIVDDKLMGFGTTVDEKVFNLDQLKELLARQQEQSNGLDLHWEIKPLSHYTSADENTAFFADDLFLNATIGGEPIKMYLRFSVVLSYVHRQWRVIHWHGSKPENVQSEEDTFGLETWKQKAEALEKLVAERTADLVEKNRELEIETSLERVRAVAMSMHKAGDLLSVSKSLFAELKSLGFHEIRNALINTFNDEKSFFLDYDYSDFLGGHITLIPYNTHPLIENHLNQIRKATDAFAETIVTDKELESWIESRRANGEPEDLQLQNISALYYYFYSTGPAAIGLSTYSALSEEKRELLKRFRNVFKLAYQRYDDIQKAEAQAKEARIETALERVRAVAMAMKQSDELIAVCEVMYKELLELGFTNIRNAQIAIENDAKQSYVFYVYSDFEKIIAGEAGYESSPIVKRLYMELGKSGDGLYEREYSPEEMDEWRAWRKSLSPLLDARDETVESLGWYMYAIGKGNIGVSTFNPITKEQVEIVKRFKNVFALSYQRFDDLQKAEAQASEAQLEAGLERVRSRSLAMHHTSELQEVIHTVHHELLKLNLSIFGGSFIVINKDVGTDLYVWGSGGTADTATKMLVPNFGMAFCTDLIRRIQQGPGFFTEVFSLHEKVQYFTALFKQEPWSELPNEEKKAVLEDEGAYTRSVSVLNHTSIFIVNQQGRKFTEDENNILERFSKVFEQSYTRFLDLQKAEEQVREAQIETALEKVRSRTLAMQKSDELTETAAVLFQQLILLGIAPNRLYIGIVKDSEGHTEFWITDEDGGGVRSAFEVNLSENPSFNKMLEGWKEGKKSLVIDMKGKELKQYLDYLGSIHVPFNHEPAQNRRMQYVAYFSKGFIGMASPDEQPAETMNLLERFAYVFNLTFTRFNDLQLAEAHAVQAAQDLMEIKAAKQKAEETLTELQLTQKQLIQSEKMASLGELTAGIAHEIQNPLNFVNNFSEVSNELLDEMIEEVMKGNYEEVKAIADDVKQNLAKINHHGRRADGIVKGMLQHSRTSSGQKELTDINALADEYLRLAYHGLRAKDKSFTATLNTDYDATIGNINIIPQDIGRVILNLITNAFYAVGEKKKGVAEGYIPTVSVSTKKLGDRIEVRVQDNGGGIPPHVIDKIFQPFFSTKPTGQGTGLGLSLAYDIVKAHGGQINVQMRGDNQSDESLKLSETCFSIVLPYDYQDKKGNQLH